jgi:hypothetical protein
VRVSFVILFVCIASWTIAQEEKSQKVIQFAGVIFGADSLTTIPNTHVYIPKSGRGTTSNIYGFFSLPVLEGDSVVFSSVGYKRAYYVVPKHESESSLRVVITLKEDIQFLEEVEIRPYPSEAMFKEALITMELPYQREYANIYQWLQSESMALTVQNIRASPNENFRNSVNLYNQNFRNQAGPSQIPLLNPFAWNEFIKSFKKR